MLHFEEQIRAAIIRQQCEHKIEGIGSVFASNHDARPNGCVKGMIPDIIFEGRKGSENLIIFKKYSTSS